MAYNKARAEKKWLKWKEAEEKKLRELGVDEETIQRLHTYDWAEFNRERRYLQRQVEWSPYVDLVSAQDLELPVEDVESLMDSIEDMELLRILSKEDKLTIQIAFLKMSGYIGYEIAEKTGLTQKAVNLRMVRLRKSAMTSCGTAATPQRDGSLCRCFERSLLTGKRGQLPFLPRPWPEYYDTHYRLPTRQMGWPTLGCNQQDPRRASERLVNCKPARTVPRVAGGRVANTAHHIN